MYKFILFDLDGTLTDPRDGIVRSVRHALLAEGLPAPAESDLTWVIGPPLRESFRTLSKTTDNGLIERLMTHYRDRFAPIGIYENVVFPDIPNVLKRLVAEGRQLFLATSKPAVYAQRILDHFALTPFFSDVCGSELDGTREDKGEVIAEVIARNHLKPGACVMVGDRRHDIIGAKRNGIASVGVLYGFGSREELEEAGANAIAQTPHHLLQLLMRLN